MTRILSDPPNAEAVYNGALSWQDNILKIISLGELMRQLDAHRAFEALERVKAYEEDLRRRAIQEGHGDDPVTREEKDRLTMVLDEHVSYAFNPEDFVRVADAVYLFYPKVERNELKLGDLWNEFAAFRMIVQMELFSRLLMVIDPSKAHFYGRSMAFGPKVAAAYPSAASDIEEACNCYALDLNTACVFHLMRVLEKGLRALAKRLNVQCEIENWKHMIQEIEATLKRMQQEPRSPEKIQKLKFYADCATEFFHFQHAWRNHVMHAQVKYDEQEALAVMGHVEAFMKKLSEEITES